jgi:hypothetical protein
MLLTAILLCQTLPLVAQTASVTEAERWRDIASRVAPAALVTVRLKDGSRVKGVVLGVDTATFTLKPKTRIPVAARDIAFADVASIERTKDGLNPGTKVLIGAASVVGGLIILAAIALATYD